MSRYELKNILPTLVIGFYNNDDFRILEIEDDLVTFQIQEPIPDIFSCMIAVFDFKKLRLSGV